MGSLCRCLTLKRQALLSCLFPISMGLVLICGGFIDPESPSFVGVCLIMGALTISTGLIGMVGVASKILAAIDVTRLLLVIENVISMILGVILLIDLLFIKRPYVEIDESRESEPSLVHPENARMLGFLSPRNAPGEQYILQHRWAGYTGAALLLILGLLGFVTIETLGAYKQDLDVEVLVADQRSLLSGYKKETVYDATTEEPKENLIEEGLKENLIEQEDREQKADIEEL